MPIAVKDYSWQENDEYIYLTVPLKGVPVRNVSILSTETYIKVSYPPYFFECFLNANVYDETSSAEMGNGIILFKLLKHKPGIWNTLQVAAAVEGNKEEMKNLRLNAIENYQKRIEENEVKRSEKKRSEDKYALKQQMNLEDVDRKRIENVKQSERQKATEDLENWKDEQRKIALKEQKVSLLNKHIELETEIHNAHNSQAIFKENKDHTGKEKIEESALPAIRGSGTISVKFTHRHFPTAARESTATEEEEWLKKQAEARRIGKVEDEDLTEEEKNPEWLKEKGISFFKSGDYYAAINAFSHAIKLSPKMASLFSNRSASNLKIGNYVRAAEDAAKALELLTPPVKQNASARCKAHIRRGTALCHLELYVEGLLDYEAALKLDPDNQEIQNDADKIRKKIQSSE